MPGTRCKNPPCLFYVYIRACKAPHNSHALCVLVVHLGQSARCLISPFGRRELQLRPPRSTHARICGMTTCCPRDTRCSGARSNHIRYMLAGRQAEHFSWDRFARYDMLRSNQTPSCMHFFQQFLPAFMTTPKCLLRDPDFSTLAQLILAAFLRCTNQIRAPSSMSRFVCYRFYKRKIIAQNLQNDASSSCFYHHSCVPYPCIIQSKFPQVPKQVPL